VGITVGSVEVPGEKWPVPRYNNNNNNNNNNNIIIIIRIIRTIIACVCVGLFDKDCNCT
jgi:hypothetical protein